MKDNTQLSDSALRELKASVISKQQAIDIANSVVSQLNIEIYLLHLKLFEAVTGITVGGVFKDIEGNQWKVMDIQPDYKGPTYQHYIVRGRPKLKDGSFHERVFNIPDIGPYNGAFSIKMFEDEKG